MRSASASGPMPYWTANTHALNSSRPAGCDFFVASGGTAPAILANARYGSPDRYAAIIFASPDSAAAIPNSCCCQSIYATPYPGDGFIKPRSHTLGPNMYRELLG